MRVNQVCTATILHIENVRYAKYVHFRCKITKFTDLKNPFMLKKMQNPSGFSLDSVSKHYG